MQNIERKEVLEVNALFHRNEKNSIDKDLETTR